MTGTLLEMKKICKSFGTVDVLKEIDFKLNAGEVHAILGSNGAGKSTLVKMISGAYQADSGEILLEGSPIKFQSTQKAKEMGISIVYQEFSLFNHLSVAENIFAGRYPVKNTGIKVIDYDKLYADSDELLKRVGVDIDSRELVENLPVGEQQIVEICKAISLDAKILILDEPTSALNAKETKKLFEIVARLKESGVGIIYITHRLNELSEICDCISVFRDGKNIGTYKVNEKSISEMVDLMLGAVNKIHTKEKIDKVNRKNVLSIRNLTTKDIENISFNLKEGEILGITGQMGSGRTELLKTIFGYEYILQGQIELNGKLFTNPKQHIMIQNGIGFVTEDRKNEGILLGRSVRENIVVSIMKQITSRFVISNSKEDKYSKQAIKQTGFFPNLPDKEIEFFSGGNQQKAILGRWLVIENLKVLLLDEPTRGIDVGAKGQIYKLLEDISSKGISLIVVSSDIEELIQIADRILIMEKGRLVNEILNENLTVNELTTAIMEGAEWKDKQLSS
ncbi:sugar ABC transporter ATP-binding protein [Metasolibacillus sp. FSL H7-0170]|uniref:sugar ABC transporter ATP-binding protein n=1 Tax=Metasolibacillus sp. FSL H7-0170 TaxID=2921431 RepID=UPI003157F716